MKSYRYLIGNRRPISLICTVISWRALSATISHPVPKHCDVGAISIFRGFSDWTRYHRGICESCNRYLLLAKTYCNSAIALGASIDYRMSWYPSLFLPSGCLIFSPRFNTNLFDMPQVSFSVATEYQCKYLTDEVVQRFTVEGFVALCACLIVQLDTTFSNLAP